MTDTRLFITNSLNKIRNTIGQPPDKGKLTLLLLRTNASQSNNISAVRRARTLKETEYRQNINNNSPADVDWVKSGVLEITTTYVVALRTRQNVVWKRMGTSRGQPVTDRRDSQRKTKHILSRWYKGAVQNGKTRTQHFFTFWLKTQERMIFSLILHNILYNILVPLYLG